VLLAGCVRVKLYTPTAHVVPNAVGFGAVFDVRLYGAKIAAYRFMGARVGPDGTWQVRLDPLETMGFADAEVTVREGDVLPLGPMPSVNVLFEQIGPTELTVKAVGIRTLEDQH
jgi:hypothetical protein